MASTAVSTSHGMTREEFLDDCYREYVDKLELKKYMGMSSENMIHVKENLVAAKGDAITFQLAAKLSGDGVEEGATLEGQEEAMSFYTDRCVLKEYRHAVKDDGEMSRQRAPFELASEFKPALTTWLSQKWEQLMFNAMASIDNVAYGSAAEAAKDTYLASNADRFLFGAAVSNNAANDHSACLAEIDSTNDICNKAHLTLLKRRAQLANPKIRPIKLSGGEEWFVYFGHPLALRDLKNSSDWINAQQYAKMRGEDNPLFTGALGALDGIIIRESPKCLLLDNVGASSIDVAAGFLCGAQALLYAQGAYKGSPVHMVEKEFDYDGQMGVAIATMFGHRKATFNSKQHGIVTGYVAAVAD